MAFADVGYASYLVPAAAVGAMGYCYMWWKVRLLKISLFLCFMCLLLEFCNM